MGTPELVTAHLDNEVVVATVRLSGDDAIVFTPTRSLLYEAEGLISDESITEYPHDVQRLTVRSGRRKATVRMEYPIKRDKQLAVPRQAMETVLHHLLAGVLKANAVVGQKEIVRAVFRFDELTVVITSARVVSNIGDAVWDQDYDEYPFAELTGISFEEGSVATQIVLYLNGRSHRIKTPNDRIPKVKQALQDAVFEYYDVNSMAEFDASVGVGDEPNEDTGVGFDFASGVEPLSSRAEDENEVENEGDADADAVEILASTSWPDSDDEPTRDPALEQAIDDLEAALEAQQHALDRQRSALKALNARLQQDF